MRSATDLARLERIGYDVWRAPVVEELAGWRLRYAHGLTSRANSAWTAADDGSLALDEKVERAEGFYRSNGLAPRFQLTDASRPVELEALLERRGYTQPAPAVSVETAELGEVADPGGVDVREDLDDGWLALWAGSREFDDLGVARTLLTGSPGRTAFARIDDVAVGRAVVVDGWLGITSMATLPAARRRGHARGMLEALVAWGRTHGATHGLLQVDETNDPARALYAQFGFRASHAYRYLVAP